MSHPYKWVIALLLFTLHINLDLIEEMNVKGNKWTKFSESIQTVCTNTKARIANAGDWGHSFVGRWTKLTNYVHSLVLLCWLVWIHNQWCQQSSAPKHRISSKGMTSSTTTMDLMLHTSTRYIGISLVLEIWDPIPCPPCHAKCPNWKVN